MCVASPVPITARASCSLRLRTPYVAVSTAASPVRPIPTARPRQARRQLRGAAGRGCEPAQPAGDYAALFDRLQRCMQVAVAEEDYGMAAKMRDEIQALLQTLPPVQQYVQQQLKALRTGSTEEQLRAIGCLAASGDESLVPLLVPYLKEARLQSRVQGALWELFMVCKSDPVAQDALREGTRMLANVRFYDRARQLLDLVLRRCPGCAEALSKRGSLSYAEHRFSEGIQDCQAALLLQPMHFDAATTLGLCHMQLGQTDDALCAFDRALSINPGLPQVIGFVHYLKQEQQREAGLRDGGK